MVYRDRFLQCHNIVIQKILYPGITDTYKHIYMHTYIRTYIHTHTRTYTHAVYCKSLKVEKICRFCGPIGKCKTFTVKHFHLVLKMAGHGTCPGSSLKEFLLFTFRLGEGLWNNAAFPELLMHSLIKLISQSSHFPMMHSQ